MTKNNEDELIRAYTMLSALRENINQITKNDIEETYVREFHTVLDKVEGIGIEVTEFRIPDSAVQPIIDRPVLNRGGEVIKHYSKEIYVDKSFILFKLDAILSYFEFITSDKPRKIGFRKPDEQ